MIDRVALKICVLLNSFDVTSGNCFFFIMGTYVRYTLLARLYSITRISENFSDEEFASMRCDFDVKSEFANSYNSFSFPKR